MDTRELILAALAAGKGAPYTPVQVQKLLFLVEKKLGNKLGQHFHFVPYNYGPFDPRIYRRLDEMSSSDEVVIERYPEYRYRRYRLTPEGQERGETALRSLPQEVQEYLSSLSSFVRRLSFSQLVSSIYREYPEMRANSVFQG